MEAKRLLLVDDHSVLRAGLKMLLDSQEDMVVVGEAASAEESIECIKEVNPDVVLLDISMPGIGGIEVISKLINIKPNARILMLTMHEDEEYLQKSLREGAAGYVLKKAVDTELLEAIRTVARGDMFLHPSMTKALVQTLYQTQKEEAKRPAASLSEREKEVLRLIALGHTNREIGDQLAVSIKTVETHKARIMEKTGCERRSELVRYALDQGLV